MTSPARRRRAAGRARRRRDAARARRRSRRRRGRARTDAQGRSARLRRGVGDRAAVGLDADAPARRRRPRRPARTVNAPAPAYRSRTRLTRPRPPRSEQRRGSVARACRMHLPEAGRPRRSKLAPADVVPQLGRARLRSATRSGGRRPRALPARPGPVREHGRPRRRRRARPRRRVTPGPGALGSDVARRRRRARRAGSASTCSTLVRAVPAQPGPAVRVDGVGDPGAPAEQPAGQLLDPASRSSTSSRAEPGELLAHDRGLERALRRRRTRAASRSRRSGPARRAGTAAHPVRRGVEHLDGVGRQNEPPASSVTTARTRSPGSACRTNTTRPSCRATQDPPCAGRARPRARGRRPAHALSRRPSRAPVRLASRRRGGALPARPGRQRAFARAACARVQLPRHARDHHAGLEQQPALEPQRLLVVQQLLPPVPDDVLGDEHADDVARAVGAQLLDVVRIGRVISRYGDSSTVSCTGRSCALPLRHAARGSSSLVDVRRSAR